MQIPDRFADYETYCIGETEHGPCSAKLTVDEHYAGFRQLEGYEAKVHVLQCDACNAEQGVCPVCTDEPGGPGWYRGESSGEMLACHVCNVDEYARQEREAY